ncbi:hypothetical protein K1T71_008236 [Dendrolimus kikuchii]|uniref:Uncharacterized protein n=1 Tax=Dendrolimus kikuchii TaxID=765133 RepID=A0ACC1CY57_9NEOP|nr:hypothetical protein K1T71_008236 [Dendrolimus kikuchii]
MCACVVEESSLFTARRCGRRAHALNSTSCDLCEIEFSGGSPAARVSMVLLFLKSISVNSDKNRQENERGVAENRLRRARHVLRSIWDFKPITACRLKFLKI